MIYLAVAGRNPHLKQESNIAGFHYRQEPSLSLCPTRSDRPTVYLEETHMTKNIGNVIWSLPSVNPDFELGCEQ